MKGLFKHSPRKYSAPAYRGEDVRDDLNPVSDDRNFILYAVYYTSATMML